MATPPPDALVAETGDLAWRFDELESVDTTDGFCGSTMTPLVDGERVRSVVVRPNLSISLGDDLSLSALFVG